MPTHAARSVRDGGPEQEILFLVGLMQGLPGVQDVILLDCGPDGRPAAGAQAIKPGLTLAPQREAADLVDVVIELGATLDAEWLDYLRARGKKTVYLCWRQPYTALVEPGVFRRPGTPARYRRWDEIWVWPRDRALHPMLQTLYRCPVHEVPYLWAPLFIGQHAQALADAGRPFGYTPADTGAGTRALRVVVPETNESVTGCCMLPALIGDMAYRMDPQAIATLTLLNSAHMQEHPTFAFMRNSLDLGRAGHVHLEGRQDLATFMGGSTGAVLAHQWENSQGIAALEVLYGGYALVHNSAWLAQTGYSYPGFDTAAGAQALLRAAREHDATHADYLRNAHAFLAQLDPSAPANGVAYYQRLLALTGHSDARVAA